ncbi:methyltransferase domain-containing protein [Nakamurella aerolata]|uniref:Methyltransferase domain-containing protein n=1 Tax=Nakamurella aerolata TaxID=1656892 RepID=A0A849A526_9ACTN|nr:methyltransferase domain-containing protein [Nakamurella aerolata]NNG34228.1 methyltransferase domain-containing protein [Nakamurella aerolata]
MPNVSPERRYTHGFHDSVIRSHRRRTAENSASYLIPELRAGHRVLDVGSGAGTITADLARLVAPGVVTALESDPEALRLTASELAAHNLESVELVVGDVHRLPFDDDEFDVVHAHQVLQHVADPVQALREMARVTRPGGIVAARDADYAGFTWYPELPELDRWRELYRRLARANAGEPEAGRRLLAWAHAAGLGAVTATASVWTYADPESRRAWGSSWADRIRHSRIAEQAKESGVGDGELAAIAEGWLAWADDPDGWIVIPHGEIIARVG